MSIHVESLSRVYDRCSARDMEGVLVAMHHDVMGANGMEGGNVHGRDEVRRYWTRQWVLVDLRVAPVEFSRGKDGEIVVEVHQIVRDLKGNLLSDKMVGHIFQVEDGLVKRFDIRGSGENRGQSTRDLGRLFSPRAARSIVSGYGSHGQKDFAPEPSLRLSGKKHIACCRLSGNCLKLGTLAAQNGCGSVGTNHTALWRSKCSVFIEGAAKSR